MNIWDMQARDTTNLQSAISKTKKRDTYVEMLVVEGKVRIRDSQ